MKLSWRFLLLMSGIFIGFVLVTWFLSLKLFNHVNSEWGRQYTEQQVAFDKYRTLSPLIREIELARKMAADPAIIHMALHESDPEALRRGIAAMESYRSSFQDRSYFAAIAASGNYYFNDSANQYDGRQLRYVLSPGNASDKWFYATIADGKAYQVNLDPDVHLGVTKIWINVLMKDRGKTLGVIGTGIDLTEFLKRTVSITQNGAHNLFVDGSMAIQLHADPLLIDYMSIAKDVSQRIRIDVLLKRPQDIEKLQKTMMELEKSPDQVRTLSVMFEGGEYVLGVAYLPEIGWYDLTLMNTQGLTLMEDQLLITLSFGATFLVALLIMGEALRRWVLNPIVSLQLATEKIHRGDFDIDPPAHIPGEVGQLSQSFSSMAKYVRDTNRDLENKVRERTEDLQHLSEIDPLTELLNRRGMTDRLEKEIARQSRQGSKFGLLLLDLDYFKRINDTYGHAAGDLALCEVSRLIRSSKRSYDYAGRWGGEEFLILLPDCDDDELITIAERIRAEIAGQTIYAGTSAFSFTASIGAYRPADPQTLDTMLQRVDLALYAAKENGRNCVKIFEPARPG